MYNSASHLTFYAHCQSATKRLLKHDSQRRAATPQACTKHTFAVVLFATSILSTTSLARSCVLKCWKLISCVSGRVKLRIVSATIMMPTPSMTLGDVLATCSASCFNSTPGSAPLSVLPVQAQNGTLVSTGCHSEAPTKAELVVEA